MTGKEPMTADNFDEDTYASELTDKEGYSEASARMKAKKKKEELLRMKKIEINLETLVKT